MPAERPRKPSRPFGERVDPDRPGQVGRRPPLPAVPIMSGLMWVVVGVVILVAFTASWKWIVGIVCIGVGLLFLRGGLAAYLRQHR
ncbi:MAG TPA: hypothetical protein VKD67_05725 [Acidimicrobiales bacterium]|nr:hypothetical protein [Acidimicrobiales bacterium]